MKNLINLTLVFVVLSILSTAIFAQEANIQNRKMVKSQTLSGTNNAGPNWVDADGDGICDNINDGTTGNKYMGSKGRGTKNNNKGSFGDGTGLRPQDGTGLGAKSGVGTNDCDGTGPKGSVKRSGNK